MTFQEFYDRLCLSFEKNDKAWQKEVGYRPEDKDSGFARWLEITGNNAEDYDDVFRAVVYSHCYSTPKQELKIIAQLDFGF